MGALSLRSLQGWAAMLPKGFIELARRLCRPYGTRFLFLWPLTRRWSVALPRYDADNTVEERPFEGRVEVTTSNRPLGPVYRFGIDSRRLW